MLHHFIEILLIDDVRLALRVLDKGLRAVNALTEPRGSVPWRSV
jgi:hypothetical protein